MWSQSYIILSSSFEGRSLSTFSLSCCCCAYTQCVTWTQLALQLFPLNLPPLTYQLPTLSSKQLFTPYKVLLFSFPSDAAQWLAKPGHTSVGKCGIYWDEAGEGRALCASERTAKRAPGKRWLGQGWGSWGVFGCLGKMKEEGKHIRSIVGIVTSQYHSSAVGAASLPCSSCGQIWVPTPASPAQSLPYLWFSLQEKPLPHGAACSSPSLPSLFLLETAALHLAGEGRRGHEECILGLHRGKDVELLL